jgi:hypothetical protein
MEKYLHMSLDKRDQQNDTALVGNMHGVFSDTGHAKYIIIIILPNAVCIYIAIEFPGIYLFCNWIAMIT